MSSLDPDPQDDWSSAEALLAVIVIAALGVVGAFCVWAAARF